MQNEAPTSISGGWFTRGRLVFDGCTSSAPFPSLLSFFGKLTRNEFDKLEKLEGKSVVVRGKGYIKDDKTHFTQIDSVKETFIKE